MDETKLFFKNLKKIKDPNVNHLLFKPIFGKLDSGISVDVTLSSSNT